MLGQRGCCRGSRPQPRDHAPARQPDGAHPCVPRRRAGRAMNEPVGQDADGDAVLPDGTKWTLRQAIAYTSDHAPLHMPAEELAEKTAHAFVETNLGRDIVLRGLRIVAEEGVEGHRLPEGLDPEEAAMRVFVQMAEADRVAMLKVAMADLIQKY